MSIHYYLSVYPMEALVASQLDPEAYGAYMAIGDRKGSAERLMFFEVPESAIDASPVLDGNYARSRCVAHSDGAPKHSVYLSVYRALEALGAGPLGRLWLTTKDGRSLPLDRSEYADPDPWTGFALYKELCPATPLVVSALNPKHFAEYIVSDPNKVTMPALVFADLAVPDLEDREHTGNVGGFYDKNMEHLRSCLEDLKAGKGKLSKVVDRSYDASFSYQVISRGIYVASSGALGFYPMPSREDLKKNAYDWAKSALIF